MNARSAALNTNKLMLSEAVDHSAELAKRFGALHGGEVPASEVEKALATEFGHARIAESTTNYKGAVARDTDTGLFIKYYRQKADARLQYETMNALCARFGAVNVGIAAVRHLALFEQEASQAGSVALIEPALGESTSTLVGEDRHIEVANTVRSRIQQSIGRRAGYILANDIECGAVYLSTRNVYASEDGVYTLIDQPFYMKGRWGRRALSSLRKLGVADTNELARQMKQQPPIADVAEM